jgi:hypothetical protein
MRSIADMQAGPHRAQLAAALVAILAQDIAKARGRLAHHDPLAALPLPEQQAMRRAARFAINPDTLAEDGQVHLRRTLAHAMYGTTFDRLPNADRCDVADVALVAWTTVVAMLAGTTPELPDWEFRCLTFTGEYDPALLQAVETREVS